ncbi:MAG: OmpA family protein [Acidobacteria bacterium]|nr:OmpA family protein [Acidobacteriota bacterium]
MKAKFAYSNLQAFGLGFVMLLAPEIATAQQPVQVVQPVTHTVEALALTFPEGKTISVKLKGNERLTKANGEAKVKGKKGTTEIEIELDEMKPAAGFGGDYKTYVLWAASPEGRATNLGEFVLRGNRGKLKVSSRLQTFGLFVTAEPHFLVGKPSRFVVLEMVRPADDLKIARQVAKIAYRGEEGVYHSERESLESVPESRAEVRTDIPQAQSAVRLAAAAKAEELASKKFTEAQFALRKAEEAASGSVDKKRVQELAKEAIRLAYEAQLAAEEQATQLALDAERKAKADEQARLERERQQAELARAEEARQRAEADAARARAQAEQERSRLEAEAARLRSEEARRKEEEARRSEAEAHRAKEEAQRANEEAQRKEAESRLAAERAQQEKVALRAKLLAQFNAILPTTDSERGLVVNIGDVLFDIGKSNLRQEALLKLARFAGIVLNYPELHIESEGHTDSTGSAELNQKLSEQRAGAVRDFLVSQGLAAEKITAVGRGFAVPVADNKTADGRKKNRRVELIISGEVIGTKVGSGN